MTVHTGIKGNNSIIATFDEVTDGVAAGAPVDQAGDIKNVRITSEDKDDDDLTFEEAANGETKDYTLAVTANQSTDAGSFWRLLWDNPGGTYDVVYGPHGNAVPSAAKPHFTMRVKVNGKPEVGGAASRQAKRFTFETELEVISGPELVDA